jgi:hypothetical protein
VIDFTAVASQEGLTERGAYQVLWDLVGFGFISATTPKAVKLTQKAVRFLAA